MSNHLHLRNLEAGDLRAVADVHAAAFPASALTMLGREAVRRYYEWQLTGPHDAVAVGAFANEDLAGFCFGGVFRGAMSGFLRNNRMFLCSRVMLRPWLATNPIFRARLGVSVRLLNRLRKHVPAAQMTAANTRDAAYSFGILSIATHPRFQGSGVGKLLMREAEARGRRLGFGQMHLTVSPDNQQAIKFYERLEWERVLQEDLWDGKMRKALTS